MCNYMSVYVCVYTYTLSHIYIYLYVYMYKFIHTHTQTHTYKATSQFTLCIYENNMPLNVKFPFLANILKEIYISCVLCD